MTTPIPVGRDENGVMVYTEKVVLDRTVLNPLLAQGYIQVFCVGRSDRRREREFYKLTNRAATGGKAGGNERSTKVPGDRDPRVKKKKRRSRSKGPGDQENSLEESQPHLEEEDRVGKDSKTTAQKRAERRKKKREAGRKGTSSSRARSSTPKAKAKAKPKAKGRARSQSRTRSSS